MSDFEFVNAPTVDSAIEALAQWGNKACLVAGGTNVMVDIRAKKIKDGTLINIRDIESLKKITYTDGKVSIGALTIIEEIAKSEIIKQHAPCLFAAANVFADPTTNRSATIGGNVGNASASGDTIPPLMVLNAIVHLKSKRGDREVPINEFIIKNGVTTREPDEMITYFTFESQPNTGFIKLGARRSMTISIATVAAYIEMDKQSGIVKDCRIALGGVAPKPVRGTNAEKAFIGNKLDEDTFTKAGEAVQNDISPRSPSVRATASYRRSVVPVLVKRAVKLAAFGECE